MNVLAEAMARETDRRHMQLLIDTIAWAMRPFHPREVQLTVVESLFFPDEVSVTLSNMPDVVFKAGIYEMLERSTYSEDIVMLIGARAGAFFGRQFIEPGDHIELGEE